MIGDIYLTPFNQIVVVNIGRFIAAMAVDMYLRGRKSSKVDWIHTREETNISLHTQKDPMEMLIAML